MLLRRCGIRIRSFLGIRLSRVETNGICFILFVFLWSVPSEYQKIKKRERDSTLFAQGILTESSMCLKWFNIVNHFLTALYGKWDSESHSHINAMFSPSLYSLNTTIEIRLVFEFDIMEVLLYNSHGSKIY